MKVIDCAILLSSCAVEIYLIYTFFSIFFEKRIYFDDNKYRVWGYNLIAVLLLFFCNAIGNGDMNLFLFPLSTWFYILILFYGKFGSRLLYFFMAFSIIWGSEWIYAIILGVGNNAYKNMSQMPFMVLSLKLLTYVLFIVLEHLMGKRKRKMSNKLFINYLCLPLASFVMMNVIFYSDIDFSSGTKIMMTICYIFMLLGNIIVFYAFNQYSEEVNNNLEKQILITKQKADLDYYMQRAENEESHNEFVHNTSHYLRAIDKFAQMKDYESIIKIIGEIDNQMEEHEIVSFSNYHVLNVILSEKQKLADDNNINFDIFIEPGIILNMVEDIDLIAMMGNLLDNAFRAARDCKNERYVKLKIYMQDVLGFCVIKIINNFWGDIVMDGDRFISTKIEKGIHGLGISSVNKIAEKYGGFLSCKVSDNIFEAVLLLSTDK